MSTLKTFKDGRIGLIKIFGSGVTVNTYPQIDGSFQPHINYPYSLGPLTDNQLNILNQYGLRARKSFDYTHIYFEGTNKVQSKIEALSLMEALKPIASALVYTSK
jgi:hypothetical protein